MRVGRPGIPQYKSLFRSVDLTKTDQLEYMALKLPILVGVKVRVRVGHVNRILSVQYNMAISCRTVLCSDPSTGLGPSM